MDLLLSSIIIVTASTLIYAYYYRKNILVDSVIINHSQTFQGLLAVDQQHPNYFEATKYCEMKSKSTETQIINY